MWRGSALSLSLLAVIALVCYGGVEGRQASRRHGHHVSFPQDETQHLPDPPQEQDEDEDTPDKIWRKITPEEDAQVNVDHHKEKKSKLHWKKHHPVEESRDSIYKDEWKRITQYHKTDEAACEKLRCRKREVCLVNAETGDAECLHKRVLRLRRKLHRMGIQTETKKDVLHTDGGHRRKHNNHGNIPHKMAYDYKPHKYHKKTEQHHSKKANSVIEENKADRECSPRDMEEMGRRLLDCFKLLQDEDKLSPGGSVHHKEKRNSKKKDLREDCGCQSPVSWEFEQLDVDTDGHVSNTELREIEDNLYEKCVTPFFDSCDKNYDSQISETEWCCCFATILPPCLAAQKKLPHQDANGKALTMPGAYIPDCDDDGFYKRLQCHSSSGQCWCVDRNGHEIPKTRVLGNADCGKYDRRYLGYLNNL